MQHAAIIAGFSAICRNACNYSGALHVGNCMDGTIADETTALPEMLPVRCPGRQWDARRQCTVLLMMTLP